MSHHGKNCDVSGLVLLSVNAAQLDVCGWLGVMCLDTHICSSSMSRTTERSAIKMTLTVKCNEIQRCFRRFLSLELNDQRSILNNYHVAVEQDMKKWYNTNNKTMQYVKKILIISRKPLFTVAPANHVAFLRSSQHNLTQSKEITFYLSTIFHAMNHVCDWTLKGWNVTVKEVSYQTGGQVKVTQGWSTLHHCKMPDL